MNRTETKAYLVEWLGGLCADCRRAFPLCCYDFDHRDPTTKSFCVSEKMQSLSLTELLAEVNKCDLVCANCHRIRTSASPLLKEKMRKSQTGRKHAPRSDEWKRKQRESQLGMKKPAISKALVGVPWSAERRAAKCGTHWSPARRASYEARYQQEKPTNA